MRYCVRCNMPDTRPGSIFTKENVCQACINYEKRKEINWEDRKKELKSICDKYRRSDGNYDCLIPVSGGKDSHMLVYRMKMEMNMNPLLVTVGDPFTKTQAGNKNIKNLSETFNCDHYLFSLSSNLFRRATRFAFENSGEPLKFVEAAIYTIPFKLAQKFGIPLVVFGEDSGFIYGNSIKERMYATDYILQIFQSINPNYWIENGFSRSEINAIIPPSEDDLKRFTPDVLFMSYFVPWSSTQNLKIAKRYGFHDVYHEWQREGYIEHFEQIDSIAYIIHLWLKYPKFGFQRISDVASRYVREGLIDLDEAKKAMKQDEIIDQKALDDFCQTMGYSIKEFWDIVEKFWNKNIFEKKDGIWVKKALQ